MLNTDVINYLENCRYWRLKYIVVNREEVSECADDWRAHLPPEILSERVPTSKLIFIEIPENFNSFKML